MNTTAMLVRWTVAIGCIALLSSPRARASASEAQAADDAIPVTGPRPEGIPEQSHYNPSIYRGGASRSGDLGGLALPTSVALQWQIDFAQGIGDVVVSDGHIYIAGGDGTLSAIAIEGRVVVWRNEKPGRHFADPPTVVGDRIYVATDEGLSAMNRADGRTLWRYPIEGGAAESSPLVVGDRILVAGYDGFIHAVSTGGLPAWTHDLVPDAPEAPPGFDQKRAVITGHSARPRTMASDRSTVFVPIFDQSRVVAVDVATGKRRWSFQTKGWMYAEPTVAEDHVFVTSQDKSLYCLDKANGQVRWSFPTKWRVESGVAVRDGSAYFGSCDGFFYRVDVKTGKALWSFETPKGDDGKHYAIYSSPIVSEDTVCFGSFDGNLYALKTADGTLGWKIRPVEGAEVVSSPVTDGHLILFSVRYDQFKKTGSNSLLAVGRVQSK